jgi:hypothetical protein
MKFYSKNFTNINLEFKLKIKILSKFSMEILVNYSNTGEDNKLCEDSYSNSEKSD